MKGVIVSAPHQHGLKSASKTGSVAQMTRLNNFFFLSDHVVTYRVCGFHAKPPVPYSF